MQYPRSHALPRRGFLAALVAPGFVAAAVAAYLALASGSFAAERPVDPSDCSDCGR